MHGFLLSPAHFFGCPSAGVLGKMNGRKLSTALLASDGTWSERREAGDLEEASGS